MVAEDCMWAHVVDERAAKSVQAATGTAERVAVAALMWDPQGAAEELRTLRRAKACVR